MDHESGDVSRVRRSGDAGGDRERARVGPADDDTGEPAMQPCLACGLRFPLTPANHDGYGPVCPNCGCLI